MKKVLIASTAIVAAGMLSAGAASASEKIKLNLGGYSKWWVVGAQQSSAYKTGTNGGAAAINPVAVDVKGDNEVYFGGKTTLDNGLEVGIDVQLEAGGHGDTRVGTNSAGSVTGTTDVIDESYVYIAGGFGKLIVGSKNNGTYLIHSTAPDAAGNWNEGGVATAGWAIAQPSAVQSMGTAANNISDALAGTGSRTGGAGNTTAILTDGDSEGVTYVSPTFYGFTFGASYKPDGLSEDNRGVQTAAMPVYGAGILYTGTIAGVGIKADVGYAQYDASHAVKSSAHGMQREYSTGAQLSYAGFTLGGSYRQIVDNMVEDRTSTTLATTGYDGRAWDIGLQYASGPYAVSIAFFESKVEGTLGSGSDDVADRITVYQVSGKYNLGAGVDALASIAHADFKDELATAGNSNKGWTAMTGLSLAF